jgi:tetratricopeptide (TPR) repeat protein
VIVRALPALLAALALACATSGARPPATAAPGATAAPPVPAGDAASLVAQGEAALKTNDFAKADALLAQAAKLAPTDPRPLALRSVAVFQQARFKEALELAKASLGNGETYEARLVEGRVSAITRRLEDAVRAYDRCAALRPDRPEAWSAVAAARLAVGDGDAAAAAWGKLAALEAAVKAEDRLWTDILRLQPDPAQVQEALDRSARGTAAYVAGKYAEAAHELQAVVGTIRTFGHAWSELGKAYAKLGRPPDAERALRTALESYRKDQDGLRADTQVQLARILLDQNRNEKEALSLARAAKEIRGERSDVVATLARACERTRDPSCATSPSGEKLAPAKADAPPSGTR